MVKRYDAMVTDEQRAAHTQFCKELLPQSELCQTSLQVQAAAQTIGIEVALSGSDAVLRLDPKSSRDDLTFPNPFWLKWAKDIGIKQTGFLAASSMGSNYLSLTRRQRKSIGETLRQLRYIGLRDRWTMKMLGLCDRKLQLDYCPDPVSVFNDSVPQQLPTPCEADYLVMSLYPKTASPEWIKQFVKAAHEKDLRVFSLPHPEAVVPGPFDRVLPLPMTPLEWYAWLKHSKGYVGVRFHPIMISIVNSLPFVALDHYESGLRFGSRWLTLAAKPLKPWLRFSSKTFDLATRVEKPEFCLNPHQFGRLSGRDVFDLFWQNRQQGQRNHFVSESKNQFWDTLTTVCGDSDLSQRPIEQEATP